MVEVRIKVIRRPWRIATIGFKDPFMPEMRCRVDRMCFDQFMRLVANEMGKDVFMGALIRGMHKGWN